jgi:hypothetical protein
MPIKISDPTYTDGQFGNELRIGVLEKLLEHIINSNKINIRIPRQDDIDEMRRQTFEELKRKYGKIDEDNKGV